MYKEKNCLPLSNFSVGTVQCHSVSLCPSYCCLYLIGKTRFTSDSRMLWTCCAFISSSTKYVLGDDSLWEQQYYVSLLCCSPRPVWSEN